MFLGKDKNKDFLLMHKLRQQSRYLVLSKTFQENFVFLGALKFQLFRVSHHEDFLEQDRKTLCNEKSELALNV